MSRFVIRLVRFLPLSVVAVLVASAAGRGACLRAAASRRVPASTASTSPRRTLPAAVAARPASLRTRDARGTGGAVLVAVRGGVGVPVPQAEAWPDAHRLAPPSPVSRRAHSPRAPPHLS